LVDNVAHTKLGRLVLAKKRAVEILEGSSIYGGVFLAQEFKLALDFF